MEGTIPIHPTFYTALTLFKDAGQGLSLLDVNMIITHQVINIFSLHLKGKPGPKDGHSACILNDHLLIFGGYQDDFERLSQDLHMLNLKTMIWTYVKTTGSKPCVRDFHSASVIDGSMYIFGGRSDTFQHNRVEVYDNGINYIDFQSKTWHKIDSIGTVPDGRRSHSAIVYQNKIFIFGGYNENKKLHYNDLYCFDPKKHEWTLVNTIGQKPSPRRRQV